MNDAPRNWWNRLDAAVKAMGLLPARADRCTYVSYADTKKKTKQVVHATGDNEATQSFEQTGHLLDEDNYNEVYENILQQLMETDEYEKLRVWTSDVEKRGCLSDCEEDVTCMEESDHAQDSGRRHEQGDTGEVHWR